MLRLSQLPWALAMALVVALQASATPSVNVGMNAAFPRGPYLLELLETAAGENATSYFPLLDKIGSGYFTSATSDSALYTRFLEVLEQDGHIASAEALSTFNLALSLRSAAPRVEANYQYYSTAVEPVVGEQKESEDCQEWVLVDHNQYCTPSLDKAVKSGLPSSQGRTLPFDRVLGAGKEAVLYADPTSPSFGSFHQALSNLAQQGKLSYRLRYRRSSHVSDSPLSVSGYGVELALKRTDYIVIDDREASQDTAQKPINTEAVLDEEEEVADLKPLSTSELASLGLKTASFILKSENPFDTLVKSTQDFPKFSTFLAAHETSEDFIQELQRHRAQQVPSGISFLWMNGVQLIERQIEPFALVEMIRRERKLVKGVRDLGFSGKQAVSLLGHEMISEAKSEDEAIRFDWTDRLEDGRVLIWLNDLENDERYEGLPRQLMSLLQRTYPGQLPQVALNIFHVVAPIDFSNADDIAVAIQLINFMERGVMLRFGFIPLTSSPDAIAQAKIVYHLIENYGFKALLAYLQAVQTGSLTSADEKAFANVIKDHDLLPEAVQTKFADVLNAEGYAEQTKLAQHWAHRLNADTSIRPVFANGVAIPREKNWMQILSQKLTEDLQVIQRGVYHGVIDEETWLPGVFLEKAMSKRNTYIFLEDNKSLHILDVNKIYSEHADLFNGIIPVLESYAESTKENWAILSVVADLDTDNGQELLVSALAFKRNNPGVRLDVLHNPSATSASYSVNTALKDHEAELADVETLEELKSLLGASKSTKDDSYGNNLPNFLSSAKIPVGTEVLVLNGRVIGPISLGAQFKEDDFQQLLEFEQTSRILPVYAAVDDLGLGNKLTGPLAAAKLTSITALSTISELPEGIFESAPAIRSTLYNTWNSTHTAIEVGDPESASIHIAGLLNPTSEQGQRWAPILKVLSELDGVYLKLFLNPRDRTEELPIKRFFRYVLDSKPSFDEAGNVKGPKATFKGLPSEALLTAAMDVPPAWLVAPKDSIHDLDNIKLSSVKADVEATYELENILIEGHSRDGSRAPPRGAQLVLGTEENPLTDTIIMANLGYFQFKANPGFYNIQLKEGRSTDIFSIESIGSQGYSAVPGDEGTDIALMDFQGTTLYPRLKRKPGMEEVDVLKEDDAGDDGIVAKGFKFAEGILGGSRAKSVSAKEHAEINIFSVASGHLYERMLNIMMVSVMRNTKHTVKFWFIEQFLSPSFKDFIPHMAAEYGFKYEMVTYKWPHWLRQQKEKQREIWGYKILFLDVLFPLSLDKVIFVDADQIVRTDMIDLVNLDLEGAPYGFTPMCDSRTEMEGFRFWKQGYWANYLRGLPYHISALYVVDLRRFREIAAGDRLRQQYHALSADPNSLSNLDQDLPNHMQFQIPIHSLSQEWLWCETWCSDESLTDARTIDLCNNPQTKEPKLDRARRQVPEWTEYDDEIAALDRRRKGGEEPEKEQEGNTKKRTLEEPVHTKDEL